MSHASLWWHRSRIRILWMITFFFNSRILLNFKNDRWILFWNSVLQFWLKNYYYTCSQPQKHSTVTSQTQISVIQSQNQQQICTTKSATQTEPRMKSRRGPHLGLMPIPLWLRSSCFSSPVPSRRPFLLHPCFTHSLPYFFSLLPSKLVAWHSGRTSVSGRRTFPVLRSTCRWWVTTNVGKPSAIGQPTRPTQPFILSGSIKWVVSWNQMCAAVYR